MVQFLGALLFGKFRNAARTQYLDIIVYIKTKLHHMSKFLIGKRCCLRRDEDFHVTFVSIIFWISEKCTSICAFRRNGCRMSSKRRFKIFIFRIKYFMFLGGNMVQFLGSLLSKNFESAARAYNI